MLDIYLCFWMFCHSGAALRLRPATLHSCCFSINKHNSVFGSKEAVESESRLSSMGEDLRKKRAVFPSNLLHHIPKIHWIKPYAPKLTITAEATGA